MKFNLAIVLALTSINVFAQDLMLGDLNFKQKAQAVQWDTQLSFMKNETRDISNITNRTDYSDYESEANEWSNRVLYGVSDKFDLGLSFDYAFKDELTNTTQGPGNTDDKSKPIDSEGLSDFTINSIYRLVSDYVYMDLTGDLTLALEDRDVGTSDEIESKDGNNKQGHHSFDLGAAVGQKIDSFEWRAGVGLNYHFAGEYNQKVIGSADVNIDTDSRLDLSLNGQVQYRPITKLALGLGVGWIQVGEQTSDAIVNNTNIKMTRDSYYTMATDLSAKYNFSDSILVYAGYFFTSEFDVDNKIEIPGQTINGVEEDNKVTSFYLGGSFLF